MNSIQVDFQCTIEKLKKFNKKLTVILLVLCHCKTQGGAHNNRKKRIIAKFESFSCKRALVMRKTLKV